MFANIRRHQKWLWVVISFAVIVSFVVFFDPSRRYGQGGGGGGDIGSLGGHPISRQEYLDCYREAQLRYLFSYGEWPGDDELSRQMKPVERETRNRLVLMAKLKEMNVSVSDEAAARFVKEAFSDRETKVFHKETYDRFVKETLPKRGLKPADFERFARHEVAFQHLVTMAGLTGKLVTPQDAEAQYRHENESVEAGVVFFNSTNFTSKVVMNPTEILKYYTNHGSDYRLPDRAQVTYVAFEATNYFASADARMAAETNLSARIDQIYVQRGPSFFTDTNGAPMTDIAAKAKIRAEMREATALVEARRAATEFIEQLLGLPGAKDASKLEQLAAAKGVVAKMSEPFSESSGPMHLEVGEQFTKAAFSLTTEEPLHEEPILGEKAVFVISLKKRYPSELPAFESIKARVGDDYRRTQAQVLAREAGVAAATSIAGLTAQGKKFDDAVATLGFTYVKLPAFTQTTRTLSEIDPRAADLADIKNVAFALKDGQTSAFTPSRTGGFVLNVIKHSSVADDTVKKALPEYLASLRKSGQNEAFSEWFRKQTELSQLKVNDRLDAAE